MNKFFSTNSYTMEEWLTYIASCHPNTIDLGLERIKKIAVRLDLLNFDCPIITVAGTNGKGSCVALTEAILTASGYRVGSYYSPHLLVYNERIQIANNPVSDSELCDAFTCVANVCTDITLTYFEFGTLAALWLFKQALLDLIILEVGLGGRLDAVNCIDPDISVISTIDLDHMQWLGSTRELIAKEKAGIMRSNKPCVFGDFSLPNSVYECATLKNAFLYRQGQQFNYKKEASSWMWQSEQQTLPNLPLPRVDLQNASTVLQVIELLSKQFIINRSAIEQGLKNTFLPGRFQVIIRDGIQFILDVAHNPAGARCLSRRLQEEHCIGQTYAVVAMLADKDISNTLRPFISQVDQFYLATLEVPRGALADQLKIQLEKLATNLSLFTFHSPLVALQSIFNVIKKGDRVIIFGSFHTVSSVFKVFNC